MRALIREQPFGVHVLLHFAWYGLYEVAERAAALQSEIGGKAALHLMANTVAEADGFRRYGLPVLHAPASLFRLRTYFDVQPEVAKTHDAIYIPSATPKPQPAGRRKGVSGALRRRTHPSGQRTGWISSPSP